MITTINEWRKFNEDNNSPTIQYGLSPDKEEYVFSSGDAISTDDLTHRASTVADGDQFVQYCKDSIACLSKTELSPEDETYLRDFYSRYKSVNESIQILPSVSKLSDEGLISILKDHEHVRLFGDETREELEQILQMNIDSDEIDEVEVLTVLSGE